MDRLHQELSFYFRVYSYLEMAKIRAAADLLEKYNN